VVASTADKPAVEVLVSSEKKIFAPEEISAMVSFINILILSA